MQTSEARGMVARAVFSELIDYAGLFPPARLPMEEAAREYEASKSSPDGWLLGKFIVPYTRVPELLQTISSHKTYRLSVILDTGIGALAGVSTMLEDRSRALAESIEIALRPEEVPQFVRAQTPAQVRRLPAFVEQRCDRDRSAPVAIMLDALCEAGLSAKVRCGGVHASAFPSVDDLAVFAEEACRRDLRFKATAGLHHPVRRYDSEIGVYMHGFLNLLTAIGLVHAGATHATVIEALECEDATAFSIDERGFRFRDRLFNLSEIAKIRRSLIAYGSCSFSEPAHDLHALSLL